MLIFESEQEIERIFPWDIFVPCILSPDVLITRFVVEPNHVTNYHSKHPHTFRKPTQRQRLTTFLLNQLQLFRAPSMYVHVCMYAWEQTPKPAGRAARVVQQQPHPPYQSWCSA